MITNEIQNADVENTPTSKIIQPKEIKVLSNRNSNSLPKRPIHKKANRSNKTITIDNSNSTAYNPNNTASSSNINFSSQQILTQDTSNPLQNDSTNVSEIQPSPSIATANEWDVDTIALIKQEFLDPSNLKNNSTNIINTKADSVKTKIIDTNKRKLKFYIQIGMSMNSTFQTRADGDLLNSIDPVVGIGVKYLLNDDFQIDIGLQYTSLSGFHQSKQVEDIEYGFGFNKQVSILSTKKLHAVEAPISIHFKLNPKYSLQTGINAHYNFLSSGSLQTYEENNSGKFNNNLKNAVGYKDEFNKFDIQPLLG
ncbi:MAG: hypothetical protein ACKVQV_00645, partial [Bacteroidia bacterium]